MFEHMRQLIHRTEGRAPRREVTEIFVVLDRVQPSASPPRVPEPS
jgi:hypothetical protein